MTNIHTREARIRRHSRVREKVNGTKEQPRLCVFRSLKHIYAQVVDDSEGRTLVAASTLDRRDNQGQAIRRTKPARQKWSAHCWQNAPPRRKSAK